MKKIVVLDGHTLNPGDLNWEDLKKIGDLEVFEETPTDKIIERSQFADIILTNKTPLRTDIINQLPMLKFVGVLATGFDVVDASALRGRGIPLANVPGYGTNSVAQMVFALILELSQWVGDHSRGVSRGRWGSQKHFCYWDHPLVELSGKTLGLFGLGRIGRKTASIAKSFGMNVMVSGREGKESDGEFPRVSREELFKTSDVVSLHCPLTKETEGMVNSRLISLMKPSAFFINTARGKLVNEIDLANALNSGKIAGAGLDVLTQEPPEENHPLLKAKNCLITPHIAWATIEARSRLLKTTSENIQAFLTGRLQNIVN